MFRHSCQNCTLPVQTNIWWKTGLPLKSVTVFTSFFVSRQKNVLENGWNRPARPSDLHSNPAEKRFENNTNFLEEHDIFKWFWDLERKNFRLLTNFFLHCWQNCVLRLQSTNLIMFFRSILNFFIIFEIWKNLFSFVMQNFRRSRQKCFLRVQMTIWWKIGFPLESVTAVSSLLVAKQKNMSHFRCEEFERLSDLHFTCTDDHFEKKTEFLKKECFYQFGLRAENIFWLLLTFFLYCWQNGTFHRQSTILSICSDIFNFSNQFR